MKRTLLLLVSFITSTYAMDELPPAPTEQELHQHAMAQARGVLPQVFLLSLPVSLALQYATGSHAGTLTTFAGSAVVAAVDAAHTYYKFRNPTPELVRWKQLIALRPKVMRALRETNRELVLIQSPNLTALPATAAHLAQRKHKLEKYRAAMVQLAPYPLTGSSSLLDELPSAGYIWTIPGEIVDYITNMGNPESLGEIELSRTVFNSCNRTLERLRSIVGE